MPQPAATYIPLVKLATRYIPVRLDLAGVRWTGDWSLDGEEIVIRSAYGSRRCKLGRRKPARLAQEMLLEILAAKLAECEAKRGHV